MSSEQYSLLIGILCMGFGANLTLLLLFANWFRADLKEKLGKEEFLEFSKNLAETLKEIKDDLKEIKKGTKIIQ